MRIKDVSLENYFQAADEYSRSQPGYWATLVLKTQGWRGGGHKWSGQREDTQENSSLKEKGSIESPLELIYVSLILLV